MLSVTERRHRVDLLAAGGLLPSDEPSLLGTRAVRPVTRADYKRRQSKFELVSELTPLGTSLVALGVAPLEYIVFLQGDMVRPGLRLRSARAFFRPLLRGAASMGILPGARLLDHGRWATTWAALGTADASLRPHGLPWLMPTDVAPDRP